MIIFQINKLIVHCSDGISVLLDKVSVLSDNIFDQLDAFCVLLDEVSVLSDNFFDQLDVFCVLSDNTFDQLDVTT